MKLALSLGGIKLDKTSSLKKNLNCTYRVVDIVDYKNQQKPQNIEQLIKLQNQISSDINMLAIQESYENQYLQFLVNENNSINHGSISISLKYLIGYFKQSSNQDKRNDNSSFNIWFTLFDDYKDDVYDGDFQNNDEEYPQIRLFIQLIQEKQFSLGNTSQTQFKFNEANYSKLNPLQEDSQQEVKKMGHSQESFQFTDLGMQSQFEFTDNNLQNNLKNELLQTSSTGKFGKDDHYYHNRQYQQQLIKEQQQKQGTFYPQLPQSEKKIKQQQQLLNNINSARNSNQNQNQQQVNNQNNSTQKQIHLYQTPVRRDSYPLGKYSNIQENKNDPNNFQVGEMLNQQNSLKLLKLKENDNKFSKNSKNEEQTNHLELIEKLQEQQTQQEKINQQLLQSKESYKLENRSLREENTELMFKIEELKEELKKEEQRTLSCRLEYEQKFSSFSQTQRISSSPSREQRKLEDQLKEQQIQIEQYVQNEVKYFQQSKHRENKIKELEKCIQKQDFQLEEMEKLFQGEKTSVDLATRKLRDILIEKEIQLQEVQSESLKYKSETEVLKKKNTQQEEQQQKQNQQHQKYINDKENEIQNLKEKFLSEKNALLAQKEQYILEFKKLEEQFQKQIEALQEQVEEKIQNLEQQKEITLQTELSKEELLGQLEYMKETKNLDKEEKDLLEQQTIMQIQQIKDLENLRDNLQDKLQESNQDLLKLTNETMSQSDIIYHLSEETKRLEILLQQSLKAPRTFYIGKRGDIIDETLSDYLNKNPVPVRFTRLDFGIYIYGTQKIQVQLIQERIICSYEGIDMEIREFLTKFTLIELQKVQNQKISINTQNNDQSNRANSENQKIKISHQVQKTIELQQQFRQQQNKPEIESYLAKQVTPNNIKRSQLQNENVQKLLNSNSNSDITFTNRSHSNRNDQFTNQKMSVHLSNRQLLHLSNEKLYNNGNNIQSQRNENNTIDNFIIHQGQDYFKGMANQESHVISNRCLTDISEQIQNCQQKSLDKNACVKDQNFHIQQQNNIFSQNQQQPITRQFQQLKPSVSLKQPKIISTHNFENLPDEQKFAIEQKIYGQIVARNKRSLSNHCIYQQNLNF